MCDTVGWPSFKSYKFHRQQKIQVHGQNNCQKHAPYKHSHTVLGLPHIDDNIRWLDTDSPSLV